MYRVKLDEVGHERLRGLTHQRSLAPRTRTRLEMVRLSDAGWSHPKIAGHLRQHPQTVRHWIKVFLLDGFAGLDDLPYPGQPSAITPDILEAVRQWIEKAERTWSAGQIADEVVQVYGIRRSVGQWRRLLRREKLAYKRTSRHLKHKQNQEQVATKKAELEALEKRGSPVRSTSRTWTKRASP